MQQPAVVPATTARASRRAALWVPPLLAAAACLLAVLAPTVLTSLGLPVLAVGLLLGLPHGAVDHLLPG